MKKIKKPLSHTPRRRGLYYCSPACGFRCTVAQYDQAMAAARDMAAKLGDQFVPAVFHNTGWHIEVKHKSGHVTVNTHNFNGRRGMRRHYSAHFHKTAGDPAIDYSASDRDIRKAVQAVIFEAVKNRDSLAAAVGLVQR